MTLLCFQAASELLVPKITMSFANEDNNEDTDTGNGKIRLFTQVCCNVDIKDVKASRSSLS